MKKVIYLACLIIFSSCAKLPVQTISLTDAIIEEGERMHAINISLLNNLFDEKRDKIDEFIKNEYTPKFLENFKENIPEGTNYEEEFSEMIGSIIPKINTRRDKMQTALESQRIKLVTKLDADYEVFKDASSELKKLINSVVKLNEERRLAFEKVKNLTKNNIDFNQIETEIEKFILKSGDIGRDINDLDSTINSLLNN